MEEPDLPPLPDARYAPLPLSRKRTHSEYEINTSSDPALFSSDDHQDESADHYSSKRQKEQWKGTWWGDRLRSTSARRTRSFKRNYDSGIFMGSDQTDTSLEDELLADQKASQETDSLRASSPVSESYLPSMTKKLVVLPAQTRLVPTRHYQAVSKIQQCLEAGSENVDLSSLFLETLPSEISGLKSLTKHSRISDPPTNQDGYASIEAKLRLFLANNLLKRVPMAIMELENLRLLSLRQNNLNHIPAGIRRLVNLQSLNVAVNNLTHLPFEIVELFHYHNLVCLVADSNPWAARKDGDIDEVILTNDKKDLTNCPGYVRVHMGSSTFFRANGTRCTDSKGLDSPQVSKSKAPHLTELLLRRLSKLPELSSLDNGVVEELPETAQHMLIEAQDAQAAGGRQCTKCHADMVMPRREWLEWWSVKQGSGAFLVRTLPFLRQQCHEDCAGKDDAWIHSHAPR